MLRMLHAAEIGDLTKGWWSVEMFDTQCNLHAPTHHHVHIASAERFSQAISWSLWESFLIVCPSLTLVAITAWGAGSRWCAVVGSSEYVYVCLRRERTYSLLTDAFRQRALKRPRR